tara:strand:+ start:661 stop:885 length:225 start_codon:yes stop_codon:yes gene_type:complete
MPESTDEEYRIRRRQQIVEENIKWVKQYKKIENCSLPFQYSIGIDANGKFVKRRSPDGTEPFEIHVSEPIMIPK